MFAKIIMPKDNHKLSRSIFIREALKLTKNASNSWVNILATSQFRLKEYISKLNSLNLPVLLVNGKEDYLFISGVQKLRSKIQNCKLEIIKKCGHVCSIDKKEQFNDIALNFLYDLS
jgi:pimeloyl-ACP methyl ester carboxylesterase